MSTKGYIMIKMFVEILKMKPQTKTIQYINIQPYEWLGWVCVVILYWFRYIIRNREHLKAKNWAVHVTVKKLWKLVSIYFYVCILP